jgi:peroxiredoxin
LSDPKLEVIRAFGVEHVGKGIALPATFVVAPSGRIVYRYVGASPADRPRPEAVLEVLARMRGARSR